MLKPALLEHVIPTRDHSFFVLHRQIHMDTILQSLPEPRNANVARKHILLYLAKCFIFR